MPEPTLLIGRTCRLERLSRDHAEDLYRAMGPGSPDALWTYLPWGPFRDRAGFDGWLDAALADPGWRRLAIVVDDVVLGSAGYLRIDPAAGAVEVGSVVFGPALQRTTAATEAMTLMAAHAFSLGYRRYEWKADALNAPSRAAALRLGFGFEGVFRQAAVVKGRNRDTAWFAMTDGDWAHLAPVHEEWLAAAADGAQRWSLSAATADVRARLDVGRPASGPPHPGPASR